MGLTTLTRPDRLAVVNALGLPAARGTLWSTLITLGCLALGGVVAGGRLLVAEPMLAALADAPEVVAPPLLGATLLLPLLAALGLGLAECRRALFGSTAAELLLVAPVSRGAIVGRAWCVCLARLLVVQLALAWPGVWGLVQAGALAPAGALAYPLVAVLALAPCVGVAVALSVALRRWTSGPRLRTALNLVGGLAGIALALLAGAGLVTSLPGQDVLASTLADAEGRLPGALLAGGRLLAWTGGLLPLQGADLALLAAPLLCVPALAFAAWQLGPAWEAGLVVGGRRAVGRTASRTPRVGAVTAGDRVADRPPADARVLGDSDAATATSAPELPRSAHLGGRWPTGLVASVCRKDLLAQLRTKASLGALGFFLAVTVLAVGQATPAEHLGAEAPHQVALVLGLFNSWLLLVMVLACLQGGTLLEDEATHTDLLACAPVDRGRLLVAKLPGFVLPHLLMLGTAVAAAVSLHGADLAALGLLLAVALPILAGTLGLLLALGSLPWLNSTRRDDATQVRRVLIVGGAVFALCIGLMQAGFAVRSDLYHHFNSAGRQLDLTPYVLTRAGLLWLGGLGLLVAGLAIARRNLEQLLGPRR